MQVSIAVSPAERTVNDAPADGVAAVAPKLTPSSAMTTDSMSTTRPSVATIASPDSPRIKAFETVLNLVQEETLFDQSSYAVLRRYFADQFEREYKSRWVPTLGDRSEDLDAWFADNLDAKEELFTAIDPKFDDIPKVMQVFDSIREAHPKEISTYGSLAIATALVWDVPDAGVYNYMHHVQRCKSNPPPSTPGGLESFEYFLLTEHLMQGRVQYLPWEFLVHLVNHRTPFDERKWALNGYLHDRVMFGKCYRDVPYDFGMLNSESEFARMNGKDYILPNLKQFGGVCAMQADFAARVGKSLGVPAEFVVGQSRFGEGHAWVMWVELKAVTPTSIAFSLESYGRYRLDHYYVGTLQDPHTGQSITDRQLELRLHTAGVNPRAKRHANLLMQALPILAEHNQLNVDDRLGYLNFVLQLSPGNEAAWRAVGRLAASPELEEIPRKEMRIVLDRFFLTFANYPDFTWEVFDDLVAFETDSDQRLQLYDRLSLLYLSAKRPDLACEARMKLADLLVAADKSSDAIGCLATAIRAFPNEGRYVPRMLDKLEAICDREGGAEGDLLTFYNAFIPTITRFRGDRPSEYCITMYERAIAKFTQYNELGGARVYHQQLIQLKAGIK